MKKLLMKVTAALLCACCAAALFGCDFGGGTTPPPQSVATYVFAKINYHYQYNVLVEEYYQESYSLLKDTEKEVTQLYAPPEKLGYRFLGWTKSEGGEGDVISSLTIKGSGGSGTVYSLYAKYEPIEYTVEYHLNGGTNNRNNPEEGATLTGSAVLYDPTRAGYVFDGWYRDESFKTPVFTISLAANDETTVHYYAKWKEIFSLSYVTNLEELSLPVDAYYNPPKIYTEGFSSPIEIYLECGYQITGYLFLGWTYEGQDTPATREGEKLAVSLPVGTTGDKVFTANFLKQTDLEAVGATLSGGENMRATLTVPEGVTEIVLGENFMSCYVTTLIVVYSGDEQPKITAPRDVTEIIYQYSE